MEVSDSLEKYTWFKWIASSKCNIASNLWNYDYTYGIVVYLCCGCDWTRSHRDLSMYNAHILYPLIIGLTVISLILYSAIAYVSDYLMRVADKLHYDWSPKVNKTTDEPTVHVIYQSHQHDPTDEIIIEGEYTESNN